MPDNYPPELIQLAKWEAIKLEETLSYLKQIKSSYTKWEKGEITRAQLANELIPIYKKVKKMKDEYKTLRSEINFAQSEAVNHKDYQSALYQGGIVRNHILSFTSSVCLGYPAAKGTLANLPPEKDDFIKELYESQIEFGCPKRIKILYEKLLELKKKGVLK